MSGTSRAPCLVVQFRIGSMDNFGYLVADERSRLAAVIDPSFDAKPVQREAERRGLRIVYVLATHGHPDHCGDNDRLRRETGAEVAVHRLSRVRKDVALEDGRVLRIGDVDLTVVHTPGHSPDGCCFVAGNALFTGDTLFVGDCGRTDLRGSDPEAMYDSLLRRIRSLDDDLVVYPGHDYGPTPSSPLGHEKRHSPVLAQRSLAEFVAFLREP